jgi:hypothetical protein
MKWQEKIWYSINCKYRFRLAFFHNTNIYKFTKTNFNCKYFALKTNQMYQEVGNLCEQMSRSPWLSYRLIATRS